MQWLTRKTARSAQWRRTGRTGFDPWKLLAPDCQWARQGGWVLDRRRLAQTLVRRQLLVGGWRCGEVAAEGAALLWKGGPLARPAAPHLSVLLPCCLLTFGVAMDARPCQQGLHTTLILLLQFVRKLQMYNAGPTWTALGVLFPSLENSRLPI